MGTVVKPHRKIRHSPNRELPLTYQQIKKRVGESWAFLENPVYENGSLISANLVYYNADKTKVMEQFKKYTKGHFAMYFFGTVDADQVYVL